MPKFVNDKDQGVKYCGAPWMDDREIRENQETLKAYGPDNEWELDREKVFHTTVR